MIHVPTRRQFLAAAALAAAPIRPTASAQTRPASLQLDPACCKRAAEYSAARKGISMLVMLDGKIVFEDYPNGGRPDRFHELASGTKSFCSALAIAAAMDKLLTFDEPVVQTLTEWKDDPRRSRITLRQLLGLVSGLPGGPNGRPPVYTAAIATAAVADPGTRFQYGPVPFQIFGEVMRRKLLPQKLDVLDYLRQRVFEPIGLKFGFWRRGADKQPHMPSGAFLTAREWVKYGQLVLQKGQWQGKTVLDATRLDECFRSTSINPAYGLTWWLNRPLTAAHRLAIPTLMALDIQGAPRELDDLVLAAGAGKQRLYVSRKNNLVLVRQATGVLEALARRDASGFSDSAFLKLLLGKP